MLGAEIIREYPWCRTRVRGRQPDLTSAGWSEGAGVERHAIPVQLVSCMIIQQDGCKVHLDVGTIVPGKLTDDEAA